FQLLSILLSTKYQTPTLHDALPIYDLRKQGKKPIIVHGGGPSIKHLLDALQIESEFVDSLRNTTDEVMNVVEMVLCGKLSNLLVDRKSTRLNSSHVSISYAVFCLKK